MESKHLTARALMVGALVVASAAAVTNAGVFADPVDINPDTSTNNNRVRAQMNIIEVDP